MNFDYLSLLWLFMTAYEPCVMYADDICLMAPSPEALQELIDTCYDFRVQNDVFKFFQIVFRGQASHWPAKVILWLAWLASHNFIQVLLCTHNCQFSLR